jgi:hypothetical protein
VAGEEEEDDDDGAPGGIEATGPEEEEDEDDDDAPPTPPFPSFLACGDCRAYIQENTQRQEVIHNPRIFIKFGTKNILPGSGAART